MGDIPLTAAWVAEVMAGSIVAGERGTEFTGVSIDTRSVARGQLFVAIRGERFDVNGRVVIPTFHPAAILHGGGEAGSQMASLRADFAALKALLAEPPPVPADEQLGLF